MRKATVANEQFVRVWQGSESATEAATRLHMSYASACQRACWLRRHGVELRDFRSAPRKSMVDYEGLAKLAKKGRKK